MAGALFLRKNSFVFFAEAVVPDFRTKRFPNRIFTYFQNHLLKITQMVLLMRKLKKLGIKKPTEGSRFSKRAARLVM